MWFGRTLQWGRALADRFTPAEAAELWEVYKPVDESLRLALDESTAAFAGMGRDGPSYNSRMPVGLEGLLGARQASL